MGSARLSVNPRTSACCSAYITASLAHGGAGLGTAVGDPARRPHLREAGLGDVTVVERVDPTNSL